jgi:ABC-type uncharacterized transport system permease subunit
MNKQSLFFTAITAIFSTVLLSLLLQFITKKLRYKTENENKLNTSYTIWFTSIILSFFVLLKPALEQIENAIEIIIFSKTIENTFFEVIEKIILNIGFTFITTFVLYLLINLIFKISNGTKNDPIEMENNNYNYFLIKGITLLVLTFSLSTIFNHFLQWFAPTVDTIFYR